jgi:gentisate 1,2-dioxygenase
VSPIVARLSPGSAVLSPGHPQPRSTPGAVTSRVSEGALVTTRPAVVDTGAVTASRGTSATTAPGDVGLDVGVAVEDWTGDARFYEYSAAVDPVGAGVISPVPVRRFPASWHAAGGTRLVPLDLRDVLGTTVAATGPSLLAQFVCIAAGDTLAAAPNATSTLLYCLRGAGTTELPAAPGSARATVAWSEGDVLTLPGRGPFRHGAARHSVLYQVDDSPLLSYLGVEASEPRFAPTRFDGAVARRRLAAVAADPEAAARNRVAILFGNARNDRTLTATHTLWAMLGVLPEGQVQRPHRHQSVALDLIVDCRPGCYTLLGTAVDAEGVILDPVRVDWEPGGAFVTPPGWWHSHHNDSGAPAHLLPVQDAGLHTYLRTLDIRFSTP